MTTFNISSFKIVPMSCQSLLRLHIWSNTGKSFFPKPASSNYLMKLWLWDLSENFQSCRLRMAGCCFSLRVTCVSQLQQIYYNLHFFCSKTSRNLWLIVYSLFHVLFNNVTWSLFLADNQFAGALCENLDWWFAVRGYTLYRLFWKPLLKTSSKLW